MPWVMKLYLLGLLLSLFSALFGLLGFLGDLVTLQGLEPCLSSQWLEPEGSSGLMAGSHKSLAADVKLRTHKAIGSYS